MSKIELIIVKKDIFINSLDDKQSTFLVRFTLDKEWGWPLLSVSDNIESYGFKKQNILNKPFIDLFSHDIKNQIEELALMRAESTDDVWDDKLVIDTPLLGKRFIHAVAFRQVNEDGSGKIVGYFKDITELEDKNRKYQSALSYLKTFNEQYKNVIDNVAIFAQTDIKGTITHVNDKFCEISGYSREELIGRNHRVLKSNYHDKDFFINMWKTISSGEIWHAEVCNKRKNGDLYWVDTNIVPMKNPNGKIISYMALRVDITEKKELEEKTKASLAQSIMTEKLATMGEVAATLAHEVKNPLTVIQGNALRLEKNSELEVKERAKSILEATERILNIMKGIKLIARDTSNDEKEWYPLRRILDTTYHYIKHRFNKAKTELIIEDIPENILIFCRPSDISQVVMNLINNAYDEVSNESESWIKITSEFEKDNILLKVIDSGRGIPKEVQEKIFKQFFTTKPQGKGTGLGLSLSQGIMQEHDSKIEYCTTGGHTTFKISFTYKIS